MLGCKRDSGEIRTCRTLEGVLCLIYRSAAKADLPKVLDFYHRMIDLMQGSDFDVGWKRNVHPSDDYLAGSIDGNSMIIGVDEDGRVLSALVLDQVKAKGYENIPWTIDASWDEIGVIHVLITDPAYHRRGLARNLLHAAVDHARAMSLKAIRLDTFVSNHQSHCLYKSFGFECLGPHELLYEELGPRDFMIFELGL